MDNINSIPGPTLGIIQGNIEQSLKHDPDKAIEIYKKHLSLTRKLPEVDLIVWAETMFPFPIGFEEENIEILKETALICKTPMLIGALTCIKIKDNKFRFTYRDGTANYPLQIFNSAYYLNAQGEILGRYDKIHLVPVSEYVPLRKALPFLDYLILALSKLPFISEMSPGTHLVPFIIPVKKETGQVQNYRFGVLICYESIFPELSRVSIQNGADFIINVSNDGWFKDSAELEQILIISAFRAVENKTTFVRATNTGISAIIKPTGEINILKTKDGRLKETEGVWAEPLTLSEKTLTFYNRYGDWFCFFCIFKLIIIIILNCLKIFDKISKFFLK
jgi:apolipoprotein N-acyltransferase